MATIVGRFKNQAGRAKKTASFLDLAEAEFDVLVTLDTNLRYQQNLTGRRITIVVIVSRSNRLPSLRPHFPACAEALETIRPGDIVRVGTPA